VAGNGRYDGLVEALGGPSIPAIGFAIGFDRLVEVVSQIQQVQPNTPQLFIAALGPEAQDQAFHWLSTLGAAGIAAEMDYSGRSLKSQMKRADRLGAANVLIVGDSELQKGAAVLRDMVTKQQQEVAIKGLVNNLLDLLAGV
jgi:histidyl-tRNA synthetase